MMVSPQLLALISLLLFFQPAPAQPPADAASLRQEIDALVKARKWPEAIETVRRFIALGESHADLEMQADGWQRLGLGQQELKQFDAARSSFEWALELQTTRGDRSGIAGVHNSLGILAWQQGDAKRARTHFTAAIDEYAAAGNVPKHINALRNLTYVPDMPLSERIAVMERAWELAEPLDDVQLKGLVLQNLGDFVILSGDYRRGVGHLERAVALLEQQDDRRFHAQALTSLGRAFRFHGLSDRAIAVYERVLKIQEGLGDVRNMAQTWDAIAVAHGFARRYREAAAAAERAIALAERVAETGLLQSLTMNSAAILSHVGQLPRATAMVERVAVAAAGTSTEIYARNLLANFYRQSGRRDDALAQVERSLPAAERAGRIDAIVTALAERARLRWLARDAAGALADARRALDSIEQLRGNAVALDAMKRTFIDPYAELFGLAIEVQQGSGDAAGGLETAERARARALLDLLASRELEGALPAATRGGEPALPSRATEPAPALAAIRDAVGRRATTLVTYWVASDATTIWVLKPNGEIVSHRTAVPRERYDTLARQLARMVSTPTRGDDGGRDPDELALEARSGTRVALARDPGRPLRELYDLLMAPIAGALPRQEGELLTIVPHGPLFSVPFAALVDKRGRYLIEDYRMHIVPSAALLTLPAAPRRGAGDGIVVVADPQPMAPADDGPLGALPGAREEGRAIARVFPAGRATTLIGGEATEDRLRELAGGRRALHFATHGLVFDDRPFESFLAMAGGRDARLEAGEIYRMRLDADLVVLSACRTAAGTITGDGVIGLARAFLYAGASSIVASLWDLPDSAPLHLMPAFYKRWLQDGEASAALREAQLSYLRALRAGTVTATTPLGPVKLPEHPVLWAGMVLIGQP